MAPSTPRPRFHHAFSDLDFPSRSADSGYGSVDCSPEKTTPANGTPRTPSRSRLADLYDGNGSGSDTFLDSDSDDEVVQIEALPRPTLERLERRKRATLPKRSIRHRTALPSSLLRTPRSRVRRSDADALSNPDSIKSPDRFVPVRDHSTPSAERFRTSKDPGHLTSTERLLRHSRDAPDAFCYTRRSASVLPTADAINTSGDALRGGTVLSPELPSVDIPEAERQVSNGTIWTVGGLAPSTGAIDDGHGSLIQRGTSARIFRSSLFAARPRSEEDQEKHEARLASALDIDCAQRVLEFDTFASSARDRSRKAAEAEPRRRRTFWNGMQWMNHGANKLRTPLEPRILPVAPFKVLDAPELRDDYYCSLLAYSSTCHTLAMGLGSMLYSWNEETGVKLLDRGPEDGSWLTSLDFSSDQGQKGILAYGRSSGLLCLMSLYDGLIPRFAVTQPGPVACVSWKPTATPRASLSPFTPGVAVNNDDLLVGDELGNVYYYAVEWPASWEVSRHNWRGSMTLLARISVHSQQICGLSWSPNGKLFATRGNDNLCCLFETKKVLAPQRASAAGSWRQADDEEAEAGHHNGAPSSSGTVLTVADGNMRSHHDHPDAGANQDGQATASSASDMASAASTTADLPVISLPPTDSRHWDSDEYRHFAPHRLPDGSTPGTERWLGGGGNSPDAPELADEDLPPYARANNRYPGDRYSFGGPFYANRSALPSIPAGLRPKELRAGAEKHRWVHTAAVKAIAFCPWQEGLVATGGGSNDKCIHFFHTTSGAALATVAVHAQVTSLIWSTTRREICATFGYAQPEHHYRIAVFSWPECQQVAAVPWEGDHRALFAVPYPLVPAPEDDEAGGGGGTEPPAWSPAGVARRRSRAAVKGCIVVAASDESVKFHEIWPADKRATTGGSVGMLGGSDILEDLEGIDKEGDIIR